MGKWFKVHSVSSAIGRSMVLILFMASLIAVVAMVTLFYSVPDAKAINLSGSLRMQAYRMAYEIEQGQQVLSRLDQFEQTLHAAELQETLGVHGNDAESLRGQAARLSHGVRQFRLAESAVGYGHGSAVAAPCADKAPQALAAGPAQARLTH